MNQNDINLTHFARSALCRIWNCYAIAGSSMSEQFAFVRCHAAASLEGTLSLFYYFIS